MRTDRLASLLLVTLLFAGATDLAAQRRTTNGGSRRGGGGPTYTRRGSPGGGRIAPARGSLRTARIRTSSGVRIVSGYSVGACLNCNYWGYYRDYWGWYHGGWWYPAYYPRYHQPNYHDVPEAEEVEPMEAETAPPEPAGPAPSRVRGVGALTLQYFQQEEDQLEAGRFALEYGYGLFHAEAGYSQYVTPTTGGRERLHLFRGAVGVQPSLTRHSKLLAAVGVRGVKLDNGADAYGPEGELGLEARVLGPLALNVNGRAATLSWDGNDRFPFREATTTGSLFLGPVELQAGWHWMQLDATPVTQGPVAGLRIWF